MLPLLQHNTNAVLEAINDVDLKIKEEKSKFFNLNVNVKIYCKSSQ
jgi:hypothetical protein